MYFYSFYSLSFLKNYNSSIAPFSSLSWALPCTTTWHNISLSLRMEMSSACLQVISTADLSHTENQTGNKIHMAPSMWQSAWDIIFDIHWDDLNSSLIASSFLSNALTQVHASKALSETVLHLPRQRCSQDRLGSTTGLYLLPPDPSLVIPVTFKALKCFYTNWKQHHSNSFFCLFQSALSC